jgi:hypothetical protein
MGNAEPEMINDEMRMTNQCFKTQCSIAHGQRAPNRKANHRDTEAQRKGRGCRLQSIFSVPRCLCGSFCFRFLALENAAPAGVTDPQAALASAHAAISAAHHKAGLLVLFSDLLEEPADLLAALHPFIHGRFDIVIFHILTPQELDLRKLAGHHLIDMETRRSLRTFAPAIAPEYRRRMTEHLARLRSSLAAHRIDYRLTLTTEDPIHALRHYVARRAASLIR